MVERGITSTVGSTAFLKGRVTIHAGNCLTVLPTLDENSIDSCVTDPPYHLTNNTGTRSPNPGQDTPIGKPKEPRGGFMGKQWDGGDVAFRPETWAAVLRVLKPGAHLIAFGGTRTYHRLACAIEDAGFEIRDAIMWHYGSGFPKSHDVSKGIDRAAGAERELLHVVARTGKEKGTYGAFAGPSPITTSATDSARQWEGWGTALKPATEIIVLARKPLSEPTIAANVLKHGVGAINVDGCRIGAEGATKRSEQAPYGESGWRTGHQIIDLDKGRWPANVIHDGSDEVVEAFPDVHGAGTARDAADGTHNGNSRNVYGGTGEAAMRFGDSGSASRFFYSAKADSDDRLGSKHPTVKPLDLMQYLVRLVTPPKGVVLDCFAGTGTTSEAAWREGFNAILIEREPEYLADIERRMSLCLAGPDERARESVKARLKGKAPDHGPLFGEAVA